MNMANAKMIRQIQRVINKIIFMEKQQRFEFEGVKLYPSEIHLLLVIDEKYATNATKMAEQLGVTKGAVSQTLTRLEKKGVLVKTKDSQNKNELTLTFTPLGAKAFKHYKAGTARFFEVHDAYLSTLSADEREVIHQFLKQMEEAFKRVS